MAPCQWHKSQAYTLLSVKSQEGFAEGFCQELCPSETSHLLPDAHLQSLSEWYNVPHGFFIFYLLK